MVSKQLEVLIEMVSHDYLFHLDITASTGVEMSTVSKNTFYEIVGIYKAEIV